MQMDAQQLFALIGRVFVELEVTRGQVAALTAQLAAKPQPEPEAHPEEPQ